MYTRKKLDSYGSAGRTFDLRAIAAGSNGALVTSANRACRVTVKIIQALDLKKQPLAQDATGPLFKLRVEDTMHKSREIKDSVEEDGLLRVGQNFTFDVKDPESAQLIVQVYGKGLLGYDKLIGTCQHMPVKLLLEENDGFCETEGKWYDLYTKDGKKKVPGKILMNIVAGIAEPEQKIRLFVGTWNVGNARPPQDLSAWIPMTTAYEIVAVGTQECDYPPRLPFTECGKDWLETLRQHIGRRYRVIHYTSRGQMRLVIFVRDDAEKAISDIDSGSQATGVGHVMANKGGVCIAFKFWDTGLCFVNCHFAAHVGHCETRNSNYREIAGQLRVGPHSMDFLNQFYHVFWIGDLNYRLDFGTEDERPLTPQRRIWNKMVKHILNGEYKELLQYDELRMEKESPRVLHEFKEGDIQFPPTFKMQRESTNMYDQKRMPAWCDGVLWRTLQGCHVKLLSYTYCSQILTSDHKPMGMASALETLSGQAYGAKQYRSLGIQLQRAIFTLSCVSIPLALIWAYMGQILAAFGQDQLISFEAGKYARWMIPSLFAYASLQPLVKFLQSQGIIFPMLLSSVISLFLHVPICWVLVFKVGLGNKGAALANSISNWLNVAFLSLYVIFSAACKETWTSFSKEALYDIKSFLKLAIPSALMICLEYWSFEMLILFSSLLLKPQLETSVLFICLSTVALASMIPFGLGVAVSKLPLLE